MIPYVKMLGYARDEMTGKNTREFTSATTIEKMDQIYALVQKTAEPIRLTDYDAVGKDGASIALELTAALMRNPDGDPIGFRGVLRDVSERKDAGSTKKKI